MAKKQKQNCPNPQWIWRKTGNKNQELLQEKALRERAESLGIHSGMTECLCWLMVAHLPDGAERF